MFGTILLGGAAGQRLAKLSFDDFIGADEDGWRDGSTAVGAIMPMEFRHLKRVLPLATFRPMPGGRLTMVWYVKARRPDRPIFSIVCLEARQVLENVDEQRSEGCEVWIEDVDGKQVDEKSLAQGES